MTLILQSLVDEWRERIAELQRLEAAGRLEWLGEVQLKILRYMWSRYAHDPRYHVAGVARRRTSDPLLPGWSLPREPHIRKAAEFRRLLDDIHRTWVNSRTTV